MTPARKAWRRKAEKTKLEAITTMRDALDEIEKTRSPLRKLSDLLQKQPTLAGNHWLESNGITIYESEGLSGDIAYRLGKQAYGIDESNASLWLDIAKAIVEYKRVNRVKAVS
jgi:hypothetical protein